MNNTPEDDGVDWDEVWAEKTNFGIGYPVDPLDAPTLLYQCLLGNVFTRLTYRDGSVSRGQITLAEFEATLGSSPKEGWYDQSGQFLGATPS